MLGFFIRSLFQLIHALIRLYIIIIIIRSVLSWVGELPPNRLTYILRKMTDPVFYFVHRYLPFSVVGGIDLSPIVIILALYFVDSIILNALYNQAIGGI